jgi:hypothetical protein
LIFPGIHKEGIAYVPFFPLGSAFEHLEENMAVGDVVLTDDDLAELDQR